jgi:NAD(P)-dependent dehydrogenase (short-subunit alcohol dehydrogenase family)
METNFFGVMTLTRAVLPTFRSQLRGRIIIVSTTRHFMVSRQTRSTPLLKWAIEGWAESLMFELELFGVGLALIEPGPYRTNMWEASPHIRGIALGGAGVPPIPTAPKQKSQ